MSEPKPLASLSAGLLARKGAARPAMRRQVQLPGNDAAHLEDLGWNDMGYVVDPQDDPASPAQDAGHGAPLYGLSPMAPSHDDAPSHVARELDAAADAAEVADATVSVPEVRLQQQAIATAMAPQHNAGPAPVEPASAAPKRQRTPRARAGSKGNFAFTLRLDPDRHLRLRIASATSNRSTQQILIALVDDYLKSRPEIDAFATQLPASDAYKLSDVA